MSNISNNSSGEDYVPILEALDIVIKQLNESSEFDVQAVGAKMSLVIEMLKEMAKIKTTPDEGNWLFIPRSDLLEKINDEHFVRAVVSTKRNGR